MLSSKQIGQKIAAARKSLNLSQADLAKQLYLSPQAVGKWERGESMPDLTSLNRLAQIVGVDLNYFSDDFPSTENKAVLSDVVPAEQGFIFKIKSNLGLNWNLSGDQYVDADFSEIANIKEKLNHSSFKQCQFIDADLSGIAFNGSSIIDCNFFKAAVSNSRFYGSELKGNSFQEASLLGAHIEASEFRNCNFTAANLTGIQVLTSEFRNNNLDQVVWKNASFKETQFTEIEFSGLMADCSFTQCAFSKTIFTNAILKQCFFKYCDLKRVDFVNCKVDSLTYAFLKNCKADVSTLTLL